MKKFLGITILIFITSSFTVSDKIELLIEKEIKNVFSIEMYTKQTISVSNEINDILPIRMNDFNFFKIKDKDKLLGYYYFGKAYGKVDYFDFIVIFDKELIISKVKVLVYREERGGEVGSKRWLNQFNGKTTNENLTYQKDIAAISGATISAKSMTNEMNKLLKTIHILHTKQIL